MELNNQIERTALQGLLARAKEFYQDPENRDAFNKWKEKNNADHSDVRVSGRVPEIPSS